MKSGHDVSTNNRHIIPPPGIEVRYRVYDRTQLVRSSCINRTAAIQDLPGIPVAVVKYHICVVSIVTGVDLPLRAANRRDCGLA